MAVLFFRKPVEAKYGLILRSTFQSILRIDLALFLIIKVDDFDANWLIFDPQREKGETTFLVFPVLDFLDSFHIFVSLFNLHLLQVVEPVLTNPESILSMIHGIVLHIFVAWFFALFPFQDDLLTFWSVIDLFAPVPQLHLLNFSFEESTTVVGALQEKILLIRLIVDLEPD